MIKWLKSGVVISVLFFILCVGVAFAATVTLFNEQKSVPFTAVTTVMTTTTTATASGPGAGTTYTLGVPMDIYTCSFLISGVTPTTSTINVEGAIDSGAWQTLIASTSTAATAMGSSTGKVANRIRANWSVLTKATGTTTAVVKCVGKQ
jgi:hypothetical protein